ncbi:MAG: alpha/beta fold hydrolase [Chloroflexi bacterium]|nr:alpha/beta fold hydrolase [Chloroflexota bacterium]
MTGPSYTAIVSGGERLHLDVYPSQPSDPAVIFMPGTGKYAAPYGPFLEALSGRGYQVIGIDPRGHGRSDGVRGDFTVEQLVQNVRDVLTFALENVSARVGLLGSSQGAIVVLYSLAIDDRAASAVCHNAAVLNESAAKAIHVSTLSRWLRPLAPVLGRLAPDVRSPIRRYLPIDAVYDDVALGEKLDADPLTVRAYTLRALGSHASAAPVRPIEVIQTPTLLLGSERDRLFPSDYLRSIFDRLTCEKEFVNLRGAGHMLLLEHVAATLPVVADWFDRTLS